MFDKEFLSALDASIEEMMKENDRLLIAIDGKCGAGKTTLATHLSQRYDCNVFHMDDFFLRPEQRTPQRFKEIGGNVDYERFKEEVICGLLSGQAFSYSPFSCMKMALEPPMMVFPKKLNFIEGSYSLHPTLSAYYHLKVFLTIDDENQRLRILKRNGPEKLKLFIEKWIPRENAYFDTMDIIAQCDRVYQSH